MPEEPGKTQPRRAARARRLTTWVLLAAALAVHAALWSIGDVPGSRALWGDEEMYIDGAERLAAGEAWYPEPFWPPLYPWLLAVVVVAGGDLPAIWAIQTLMLLAVALLLRDLTRHLTGSPLAGDVAGALILVYPPLVAFAHSLWPEVPHLLWFTGALWILVRRPQRPLWLLGAGALLGLALLTKSLLGPFLWIGLPLAASGGLRERAFKIAVVVFAIGAVIAPTAISNHYRSTGVLIADSLAFNLWVGLNERSRKSFRDPVAGSEWTTYSNSAPTFAERNEILWRKSRQLVDERGVWAVLRSQIGRQYFRLLDKDSFLTEMLPGGEIAVSGYGYRRPPPSIASGLRGSSYLLYALVLVGAAFGLAVCPPRGRRWLWLVVLFLIYNLAIFLLLHVKSRYRVPLLPFLFLYAGCATAWAAQRLGLNPDEAELWSAGVDHRRGWAAALASGLLLFLAFGWELVS